MRTRVLFAGLVLAVVALLTTAAPAGAQEGEGGSEGGAGNAAVATVMEEAEANGGTHEDAECVEMLAEGASVDDCQEAPSPILPPLNELVWGTISFALVIGLLWKFAWPGMTKAMDDRTERIRSDLEKAEGARTEAEDVLSGYQAQLADAKQESARILEEARQDADAVRSERIATIDGEIAEMRQRAAADVEASKAQALADLRGEVTALALGAAERVIEANLDDATNRALIDSYIDSVGASS